MRSNLSPDRLGVETFLSQFPVLRCRDSMTLGHDMSLKLSAQFRNVIGLATDDYDVVSGESRLG